MAIAIKLMGFFFFLAIPLYLLMAWQKSHFAFRKLAAAAALFVLVMAAVIILSNPFLFYRAPREEMLAIQSYKSEELSGGYEHDDSPYYARGPQYWRWTLKVSYGRPWMMLAFAGLLLAGCAFGQRRALNALITAWSLPLAIYLMWFVAPKPDHYLLPLLIPLYSAGFDLATPLLELWAKGKKWQRGLAVLGLLLLAYLLAGQFNYQIPKSLTQLAAYFDA